MNLDWTLFKQYVLPTSFTSMIKGYRVLSWLCCTNLHSILKQYLCQMVLHFKLDMDKKRNAFIFMCWFNSQHIQISGWAYIYIFMTVFEYSTESKHIQTSFYLCAYFYQLVSTWLWIKEYRGGLRFYHKNLVSPVIPQYIHSWSGRNTREHYSHPVDSNNSHVPDISPVKSIVANIIICSVITVTIRSDFCHNSKCLNCVNNIYLFNYS